jgi:hypothetical protein
MASKQLLSIAALTILGACHLSCGKKPNASILPDGVAAIPGGDDQLLLALEDAPPGLNIRISEGEEHRGAAVRIKPAKASKLSNADVRALLARLPQLQGKPGDKKSFAMRERSLPPPRTGKTIKDPFPPKAGASRPTATRPAAKGLQVIRFAPEGEVPLAPHLSVTFNQPMVAVTSHADTVAAGVPVKITPQPKGQWRWVGTRTLLFDPAVRFPAATEYQIEIPAGTRATGGAALAEPVRFTFGTPAPQLKGQYPTGGPHDIEPLMFAAFDQRIQPQSVIEKIRVEAGGKTFRPRLASADEIAKDETIAAMTAATEKNEQSGRYLVFRVEGELPKDTTVSVIIEKGTPSAEGPRTTGADQSFSFRTYGPLKVVRSYCAHGRNCPPRTPWAIQMTNPLDPEAFAQDDLAIAPELGGLRAGVSGQWLNIQGRSKGRTNYTVTLPASLTDTFGQKLGKATKVYFNVGDADPSLFGTSGLVVLDPAAKRRTFDIHSVNIKSLDVEIYRVEPRDWPAFVKFMQKNPRVPRKPPGRRVFKKSIKPGENVDEMTETGIDLSPALGAGGLGHAVVLVEPTTWPNRYKPQIHAWVQSTQIGLDAFVDSSELVAWATRLRDGKALAGVKLEIAPFGDRGTSGSGGVARIGLSGKSPPKDAPHVLLASRGKDTAFLPENTYFWSQYGGWVKRELGQSLSWFVFDDRGMYRPGEKVNVKGWIRAIDHGEGGDVGAVAGSLERVGYKVMGPRGNEIAKGEAKVTALGGFDFKIELPKTPNLGYARVELEAKGRYSAAGNTHYHGFQIQEFRRPEYEVTATASPGPYIVGKGADVTARAKYFAGGGLANADVRWSVRSAPGHFVPPNRHEWTFGRWVPWWQHHDPEYQLQKNQSFEGKTDAGGNHTIRLDFLSANPARPMNVTAETWVTDVNRQSWAASTQLLVHPSELYVGLKRDKYFVEQGQPIEIESIVVDQEGAVVAGRAVSLSAYRLEWKYKNGTWSEEEIDPQSCKVKSSADPGKCVFSTPDGGTYRVVARVADDAGRPNESEVMVWVSGGKLPPQRNVELEALTLIPNQKEYAPGDTAEILVSSPFFPAQGLMSLRRSGITEVKRFAITGPTARIQVPIAEGHVPNVTVQVDVVGSAERLNDDGTPNSDLPRRPAFAKGSLDLSVPPKSRTLAVKVKPRARAIEPGGKTTIDVQVADARGRGVAGAELAAVVVDESVLALSAYRTPDPVAAFYSKRHPGARDFHARGYVKLARPELEGLASGGERDGDDEMADTEAAPMQAQQSGALGGAVAANKPAAAPPARAEARFAAREKKASGPGGSSAPQPAIAVRKNFDALARFAPVVKTDVRGRAQVAVTVPDNLTRYRIMVVAVSGGNQFGSGESSLTARMPLMVRPSPPRFLNFGDRFELPVVLQNQTSEAMSVRIAVQTTNAALTDGPGRLVSVPANDRVEVRFPAAAEMPGIARFQIGAAAGRWSDAAELSLPVWTPATTEAFATYGEIDASGSRGAVAQAVAMPKGVVKEFGALEVTTSSTQLQALTDAFVYLISYPFECSEQTASRVIAIAALRDVLSAFEARGLPEPAEIERIVERDIKRLRTLQNYDGGFAWWVLGHESWPYNSIHAAHALIRAKEKGYAVPADMLAKSKHYLQNIERHIPWYYSIKVRRMLISYALYVRKRMGDRDTARALKLIREAGLKELSMESVGWLLGTITGDRSAAGEIAKIHRFLDNRATETAATAHWATSYSDGAHLILHSDRRADGVILESLIDDRPKSDLIPKVVRGLLAHRVRGRWSNTQENSFVLLAMDRYFREFEKVTPNFVARAWLGDELAAEQRFRGRETKRHHVEVPMAYLAKHAQKPTDLVLAKEGKGRLYYRVGMTYAPESLWLAPADHGFAVERLYEAVDDPGDVVRQKDGTWKIKAGAQVRVRVTMVAEARRYHVALVDPLPAGLEPVNPALAVSGSIPVDPKASQGQNRYWWWWRTWYEHQNMRDERIEAFASLLWAGVHEYTYVARATTPGRFVVPPTKAEEMYHPETFGRSASDKVIVE